MRTESRRRILAIAHHEMRAATRSGVLHALLGILIVATAGSVVIASAVYASRLADYQAYRAAAVAGGVTRIAPSPLAPLSLLRGAFEYIEIIGSVIAITLGYLAVSRERANKTLPLLLSRPVSAVELAAGSFIGALGVIATLAAASATVAVLSVGLIGHDWLNLTQVGKLFLAFIAAIVYMATFYSLGAYTAASSKAAANGLMVALGIWLIVVLLLPQIGDTLDADNQIPGGLFAALGLGHDGEVQILQHFATYETVRTSIEAASFAKHFERFAFAMTDVKERYRSLSFPDLLLQVRASIIWILIYAVTLPALMIRAFRKQPSIPQGANQ